MSMTPPLAGLQFHHLGIACRDLDAETRALGGLNYVPEGPDFEDPIQGIAGRFLVGGGPRLELVRPLGENDGILSGFLESGVKMYHLAYVTPDMDASLTEAANLRAKLVVPPVPAVAFEGRNIAFLFLRNMMLIELIQK